MNHRGFKEKFFCQICNRQCQDKDGFTCHLKSKTHQKNIERVAKSPQKYIDNYSNDFKRDYLDFLKREHKNEWVSANVIYDKYIKEKDNVPLNATRWESLIKFLQFIADEKLINIQPKEDDILIKYIDKTFTQKKESKIDRTDKVMKTFEKMERISDSKNLTKEKKNIKEADVSRFSGFEISFGNNVENLNITNSHSLFNNADTTLLSQKRKSKEIIEKSDSNYKKEEKDEFLWISKGLKVLINKKYKYSKGIIQAIKGNIAEVKVPDSKDIIKIPQSFLAPKPPSIGSLSKIISGNNVSEIGVIENIESDGKTCIFKSSSSKKTFKINIKDVCRYKPK